MRISNPSPDRKSQATARIRFSLSQIGLIEAVEDMQTYVLRHSNAGIAHCYERIVRIQRDLRSDLPRLRRITNCIVQ